MKGKPLQYSAAAASRYQSELTNLIKKMANEYEETFSLLDNDYDGATMDASLASQTRIWLNRLKRRWDNIFKRQATSMADKFVAQVDIAAKHNLDDSLKHLSGGLAIKTPDMPDALKDKIIAATAHNVSLIKSISSEFHQQVADAALRSISQGGEGAKTLFDEVKPLIRKSLKNSEKRADFIARDQTRKITTAVNYERMKSAGIRKAIWHHSSGSAEPRRLHLKLNGAEFDLNNPPIIDEKTGERGLPGQLPNCKCFWSPVIDFGEET
ncbi:phage minor head protein [Providencia rettgeri]